MLLPTAKLKTSILNRLKTQERAYNELGIYYTPRLYTMLANKHQIFKPKIQLFYERLIACIEVRLIENKLINLSDIFALSIESNFVFAIFPDGTEKQLEDFQLKEPKAQLITIDHRISFMDLIKEHRHRLKYMAELTEMTRNGRVLNKEQMRKEYARVLDEFPIEKIEPLFDEVVMLADKTQLELMPSHKNFSKGKRSRLDGVNKI